MNMPHKFPVKDTLGTVSKLASAAIKTSIEGAIEFFAEKHEVPSAIIAIPEHGDPKVFGVRHTNHKEKEAQWAFLKLVRSTHPITLLISEVWYLQRKGKEWNKDNLPLPSESPDRQEVVMIQVWDHDRNIFIAADITRNPDHLGEFFTVHDTQFDPDGLKMDGALNDGPRYKGGEVN
jgi:hypothetical protein